MLMRKIFIVLLLNLFFVACLTAQNVLLETSFEGPGFDDGWTIGMSQGIDIPPQDYPETGLDPWEKWDITETTSFGYVHSGDSAAWIGGTAIEEPKHDWLMTPLISIPENENAMMYYWLWYHSEMSYVNRFYIMIYDNETATWEQVYLLANEFNSPYHYTEEYKLDLNPWVGKDIKIAFVKNGTYQMAMDDVRVLSSGTDNVDDVMISSEIEVYPNPANDFVNFDVEMKGVQSASIVINNIMGQKVISQDISDSHVCINVSDLADGIYFYSLIVNNETVKTNKFVVRR